MIDIKLEQDANGRFDFVIGDDGDFETVEGFDSALWVSIFTDARASESQVKLPENRRGWPGNLVSPVENRQLGGLFWLIDQSKWTQKYLNEGEDFIRSSIQWLIDDGLAKKIQVSGELVPQSGFKYTVTITSPDDISNEWEVTGT